MMIGEDIYNLAKVFGNLTEALQVRVYVLL